MLSEKVFGHPHFMGRMTFGLGKWAKFCGRRLRTVVETGAMLHAPTPRQAGYRLQNITDHQDFRW